MNEKEKSFLYALMEEPVLFEKVTIRPGIITGKGKEILDEIQRQFAESQSFSYEDAADRLGMKISEFRGLFNGCYPFNAERLEFVLNKIESETLSKKLTTRLKKEMDTELKTGTVSDSSRAEIRRMFNDLDALSDGKKQTLTPLSSIEPREIEWLWWNRIPRGSLTLFVGDPGDGKSILCEYLAARFSKGDELPDRSAFGKTGSTIFITAEDNLADTVRVRADEAGADCDKIHVLDGLIGKDVFSLVRHIPFIEREIERLGDVCLIVFDPITAFDIPIVSSSKDTGKSVRARLVPIVRLAEKYNIAVIGITHCNKDAAKKAIYRVLGDIAFAAAARTVWLIQRDEKTPGRRYFSPLKHNLCKDSTTLAFSIDGPLGHPKITFEPEPVDISAAELLSDEDNKDKYSALRDASEWINDALKLGPLPSKQLIKEAKECGISEKTLRRAKDALSQHISIYQEDRQWYWKIKDKR